MDWKNFLVLVFLLSLFSGCGGAGTTSESEAESNQVFEVTGRITSVPADRETLVINHEEIPGFMPAMTMPFYLGSPELADGLEPGDAVRFKYVVAERRSWIEEIEEISADELGDSGERLTLQRRRLPIPRLEPGDLVPGFQLVNQDGETFSTTEFYGKAVVLTFIFTRCPVPDFCPEMSRRFDDIQARALESEELRDRFHLLSVTIDPEYDTPEVLAGYGDHYTDDFSTWTFATASPGRIDEMTTRFSVFIENNLESNTLDHALATALISPEGELVQIWRGNAWDADEVLAAMRETLSEKNL